MNLYLIQRVSQLMDENKKLKDVPVPQTEAVELYKEAV
jgi:hypothetical protein